MATTKADRQAAAEEIRKLRTQTKLTQEEFARLVGVTTATVNRWEHGRIPHPLIALAVRTKVREFNKKQRDKRSAS